MCRHRGAVLRDVDRRGLRLHFSRVPTSGRCRWGSAVALEIVYGFRACEGCGRYSSLAGVSCCLPSPAGGGRHVFSPLGEPQPPDTAKPTAAREPSGRGEGTRVGTGLHGVRMRGRRAYGECDVFAEDTGVAVQRPVSQTGHFDSHIGRFLHPNTVGYHFLRVGWQPLRQVFRLVRLCAGGEACPILRPLPGTRRRLGSSLFPNDVRISYRL